MELSMEQRMEQEKPVKDVIIDSKDGQVTWQLEYEDGSFSNPEVAPNLVNSNPQAVREFKRKKLAEYGLQESDELAA